MENTKLKRSNTRAVIWSGLIAGAVFMVLEMLMVPIFLGGSPWAPPRMISAIILGQDVLPPPATFSFGILMAAMLVHFPLSIIYAYVLSLFISKRSLPGAIIVGGIFGAVLYLINFYLFTPLFPWFAMARNWVSVFSHIVFGVVAGWSYINLSGRTDDELIIDQPKAEQKVEQRQREPVDF